MMLYAPNLSPFERELKERLKAARARMERHARRCDPPPVKQVRQAPATVSKPIPTPPKEERKPWFRILGMAVPAISDIQHVTAEYYGHTISDLTSVRRCMPLVRNRQVAMYLAKTLTPRSLPEIGRRFGDRDHTTVLHAVRKIEALLATNSDVASEIAELKDRIGAL